MIVLVTGAAGFIGTHLCKLLCDRGDQVVGLDRADMGHLSSSCWSRVVWDITRDDLIGEHAKLMGPIDAVVHLAAVAAPRQAEADRHAAWDVNVRGTQDVLELARAVKARKLVFASSAHVYGISPRYMPTDEQHPLHPLDTYTATKIAGEELCRLHHASHGLSVTILRLFNAYGPGQSPDYFLGKKLSEAGAGKPVTVMNGAVTKDWVHVSDVVRAIGLAIRTPYVGPINIGTGVETSLADLAGVIGTDFGVSVIPDPAIDIGPTRMRCDPRRAKDVLGWEPQISVQDGLKALCVLARNEMVARSSGPA